MRNSFVLKVKVKDNEDWHWINTSMLMTKAEMEKANLDLTWFFMTKAEALKLKLWLLMERRSMITALAIVDMTYPAPYREFEVVDYQEVQ